MDFPWVIKSNDYICANSTLLLALNAFCVAAKCFDNYYYHSIIVIFLDLRICQDWEAEQQQEIGHTSKLSPKSYDSPFIIVLAG